MRLIAAAICYVIHWNYDCMQLAWKVLHCFLQNSFFQSLFEALQGILFLSLALPYSSIGALVNHSATFYL